MITVQIPEGVSVDSGTLRGERDAIRALARGVMTALGPGRKRVALRCECGKFSAAYAERWGHKCEAVPVPYRDRPR